VKRRITSLPKQGKVMARHISDLYLVESLLQSTLAYVEPLRWNQFDASGYSAPGYFAQAGAVRIELHSTPAITGSRLCLMLSDEHDKVYVREPEPAGFFGRKYRSEDEERLSRAIRHLHSAAIQQCRLREARAAKNAESIRERIFSQLLFGGLGL
jgi:hypothetical protein